ncbi:hypothetical protein AAGU71_18275 (plasmid) [Edwardsiella ictaluri]|uniref:hypothetical protein n=1 Tax=Edwardsiella ictaluri TaxID=67780 RepID=UPI0036D23AFA
MQIKFHPNAEHLPLQNKSKPIKTKTYFHSDSWQKKTLICLKMAITDGWLRTKIRESIKPTKFWA